MIFVFDKRWRGLKRFFLGLAEVSCNKQSIHYNFTSFVLSPDYKITETGQMHIRNLRQVERNEKQCKNPEMKELYFPTEKQALCKMALEDCLIELEGSKLDDSAEREKSIKERYDMICSSSASESISETYQIDIPKLVQDIKEIFHHKSKTDKPNGLRGLFGEEVDEFRSKIKAAQEDKNLGRIVAAVADVLAKLCENNRCDQTNASQIQMWRRNVMIPCMLDVLEKYSARCQQHLRLLKRLRNLSEKQNEIMDGCQNGNEPLLKDASNTAMRLIDFAKFEPSKLVRFQLNSSAGPHVAYNNGIIRHNRNNDVFSQEFTITEGPSEELQLRPTVCTVRLDGQTLEEKHEECGCVFTFTGARLKLTYDWSLNKLTASNVQSAGEFHTPLGAHIGMIELYSCRVECLYIVLILKIVIFTSKDQKQLISLKERREREGGRGREGARERAGGRRQCFFCLFSFCFFFFSGGEGDLRFFFIIA